jgi:membrane protein DedA with SNARE-associated domain
MDFLNLLVGFFSEYGYFAVFGVLILCGFGLPVPEDISLVSGGVISAIGNTNVHLMFLVGMLGVLLGDTAVFFIGKIFGEKILNFSLIKKLIPSERYEKVQQQFSKYGKWVIFMARFMPGLRTPIFLTAGITGRVHFLLFLFTDFLAAIISVPVWVYLGYYGASNFALLKSWISQFQIGFFILLILVAVVVGVKIFLNKKR